LGLTPSGCRAAGRAGRSARSVMHGQSNTQCKGSTTKRRVLRSTGLQVPPAVRCSPLDAFAPEVIRALENYGLPALRSAVGQESEGRPDRAPGGMTGCLT
jgi:hypothetical protein